MIAGMLVLEVVVRVLDDVLDVRNPRALLNGPAAVSRARHGRERLGEHARPSGPRARLARRGGPHLRPARAMVRQGEDSGRSARVASMQPWLGVRNPRSCCNAGMAVMSPLGLAALLACRRYIHSFRVHKGSETCETIAWCTGAL